MQLSIITPYYSCYEYLIELSRILQPQLTNEVEWIIIDDGCNETRLDNLRAKVIHLETNSGGASKPRNVGLDIATGKYIAFIDADDMITKDYVEQVLKKSKEGYDYFYIGFLFKGIRVIITDKPPTWNCCVWNTIYKRELIGDKRFNEELVLAEDYDFNRKVRYGRFSNINKILYRYRNNPNSLTKRNKKKGAIDSGK